MQQRASIRFAALLLFMALLGASCSGSSPESAGPSSISGGLTGGDLRVGVVGDLVVDPVLVQPTVYGQMIAADLLFDGLAEIDPSARRPVAAVASKWTSSEDLDSWTFTVSDDAEFSDGAGIS